MEDDGLAAAAPGAAAARDGAGAPDTPPGALPGAASPAPLAPIADDGQAAVAQAVAVVLDETEWPMMLGALPGAAPPPPLAPIAPTRGGGAAPGPALPPARQAVHLRQLLGLLPSERPAAFTSGYDGGCAAATSSGGGGGGGAPGPAGQATFNSGYDGGCVATSTPLPSIVTTKFISALAGSRSPGPVACEFKECIAIDCSAIRSTASLPSLTRSSTGFVQCIQGLTPWYTTLPLLWFSHAHSARCLGSCLPFLVLCRDVFTARRACRAA
jgi:hypothetical protein